MPSFSIANPLPELMQISVEFMSRASPRHVYDRSCRPHNGRWFRVFGSVRGLFVGGRRCIESCDTCNCVVVSCGGNCLDFTLIDHAQQLDSQANRRVERCTQCLSESVHRATTAANVLGMGTVQNSIRGLLCSSCEGSSRHSNRTEDADSECARYRHQLRRRRFWTCFPCGYDFISIRIKCSA